MRDAAKTPVSVLRSAALESGVRAREEGRGEKQVRKVGPSVRVRSAKTDAAPRRGARVIKPKSV